MTASLLVQSWPALKGATAKSADSRDLAQLQQKLLRAVTGHRVKHDAVAALARVVADSTELLALFLLERDATNRLAPPRMVYGDAGSPAQPNPAQLAALCDEACAQAQLVMRDVDGPDGLFAVAVPVHLRRRAPESLVAVFAAPVRAPDRLSVILQLVAVHMTLWHGIYSPRDATAATEPDHAAALLQLVRRLDASSSLRDGCSALANDLASHHGWQRVVVALCRGKNAPCRLEAISGVSDFDPHGEYARALEAALSETVLRDAPTTWPPLGGSHDQPALTHQKLAAIAHAESVASFVLRDDAGEVLGAWLFVGPRDHAESHGQFDFIAAAAQCVGPCLRLLQRAERGPIARVVGSLFKKRRLLHWKPLLAGACAIAAILALPRPYKVACACRVEPVTRRFVAAPFEGRLERALVASGDVVSQGDVLAHMDGREIRWELAGLEAELNSAGKKRDSALATHNAAAAQLAKLDFERLELKMRLLEHRAENLEVRSPIAGIVTSGDLEKAEGAPVATGATLFEIAPLDKMVAEVAVPEPEIAQVRVGQPVRIRLDAYPRREWSATVLRIEPRAEIRDHANVFVAELTIDNPDGTLRPGMKGRAEIAGPRHSLAWNLFHKAWESVALALGW